PGHDKRLVAYLVAPDHPDELIEELKAHLRAKLPEYMVPAHYVQLDHLPLTPNGKTDRKALPAPDYAHREDKRPYIAPRTPTEQTLATIWATVLGIESPGVDDDFFDVGGDSLKAVRIVTALRSEFCVDAAMRHLFEQPTIAGLAEIVDVLAVAAAGAPRSAGDDREAIEI
ncbi:MAG: phosphopantetheine-binding protein, partial [Actinomycetota bacterium]|nr:phosphopantetheine-binding protein [Actinomycetota bacterium]